MIASMKPLAARAKAYKEPMKDPAAEQWFKDRYTKRMTDSMNAMMGLAATCSEHPDFQAAINELGQLGA